MRKNLFVCGLVSLLLLVWATTAQAQKHQKGVIGFGIGGHTYSKKDEVRENFFYSEPTSAGMVQLYGEWYPWERLGFGFRSVSTGVTETVYFFNAQIETDLSIDATMVTVNFLPFIADSGYFRFGLLAGMGAASYEITQTLGSLSASAETSGTAALAGVYIDWGGEDFGARAGVHALSTDIDPLDPGFGTTYEADGSGTSVYIDLRWAFT